MCNLCGYLVCCGRIVCECAVTAYGVIWDEGMGRKPLAFSAYDFFLVVFVLRLSRRLSYMVMPAKLVSIACSFSSIACLCSSTAACARRSPCLCSTIAMPVLVDRHAYVSTMLVSIAVLMLIARLHDGICSSIVDLQPPPFSSICMQAGRCFRRAGRLPAAGRLLQSLLQAIRALFPTGAN